jgi:hypothetical protein
MPVLADQVLFIHSTAKKFLTIRHVLGTTAFCVRIYRARWRLSSFKIPCNLFGIIVVVGCTNGIIWSVFIYHILINCFCISTHEERWCSCNFLNMCRKRGRFESGLDLLLLRLKILRVFNRQMPVHR